MADPSAPSPGAGRRQRADAQRNVGALLEAAKSVFATSGVDAPAKHITDLAGVGIGTLYRHFPRRSDLVVAVLRHEIDACVSAASALGAAHGPWEALTTWIGRFTQFVSTQRGLATALHSGDPAFDDLPRYFMERLEPALDGLLDAARNRKLVRADITATEVLLAVVLLCQPVPGEDARFTEHVVRVFTDGLRRSSPQ